MAEDAFTSRDRELRPRPPPRPPAALRRCGRAGVVLQRTSVASLKRLRFVLQGPPLKGDDYARSKHLSEGTSEALIGRRPGQGGRHGNDRVERRTTRLGIGRGTADHDAGRSNHELFLARQRLGLDLDPKPAGLRLGSDSLSGANELSRASRGHRAPYAARKKKP